ncbi:MAG: hypothetical protein QOE65_2553 [Solirubrobacteraceae bacterium]|jgi:hypothetical protein|nr:hypothetical protein [Solirubrobacteraceae bacterium]
MDDAPTPSRRRALRALLALTLVLAAPGVAAASTTHDLRGDWRVCGPDKPPGTPANAPCTAADQLWHITSMDLSTGAFTGNGSGTPPNNLTFQMSGTATGDAFDMRNPHDTISYEAHWTGTISADGNSMSGNWATGNGPTTSPWYGVRTSGPPGGPPPSGRRSTATTLTCDRGADPGSAWTCVAAVFDTAPGTPSAPAGPVSVVSSVDSTVKFSCGLSPDPSSSDTSTCSGTFASDGRATTLTADYAGVGAHDPSRGAFGIDAQCTNLSTLRATCADATGPPAVCGPTGTILPQCYLPVNLPVVCGGSGTVLVACQSEGPYIVACGGTGTILPQCTHPPPPRPNICGPSTGTILPACTGANNPITVCGPSGTILPQCNFGGPIGATPLDVPNGTGDVDVTVTCPSSVARLGGSDGPRTAQVRLPQPKTKCQGAAELAALRDRLAFALGTYATSASQAFRRQAVAVGPFDVTRYNAGTAQDMGLYNSRVFEGRAYRITQAYFGPSGNPLPGVLNEAGRQEELGGRCCPVYIGPDGIWARFGGRVDGVGGYTSAYSSAWKRFPAGENPGPRWVSDGSGSLRGALDQYAKAAGRSHGPTLPGAAQGLRLPPYGPPTAGAAATRPGCTPGGRGVSRRFTLRSGERRRVRIRLSRATVRRLVRCATRGARVLPVRLIVSFAAKPRPVVRFYDIRMRIKR